MFLANEVAARKVKAKDRRRIMANRPYTHVHVTWLHVTWRLAVTLEIATVANNNWQKVAENCSSELLLLLYIKLYM